MEGKHSQNLGADGCKRSLGRGGTFTTPGWQWHSALQPVAFLAALFTGEGVAAHRKTVWVYCLADCREAAGKQ